MRAALSFSFLALATAAMAQNMKVQVGGTTNTQGGVFQFIPSSFNATKGSVITFEFTGAPGNHSVTQSSFDDPCNPLAEGFDSGFAFIPAGTESGFPSWNLTITDDTKPIWFFCKQLLPAPHCKAGMVGGINVPSSGQTFAAFQRAAKSSSGQPGQAEGFLDGQGATASAPAGPFSGSIEGFGNPTSTAPSSTSSTISSVTTASGTSRTNSASYSLSINTFTALLATAIGVGLA